jgi:hypothetical protein
MLRPVLFAVAVVAIVAHSPAPAAPDLAGNWVFSTVAPGGESVVCILKVEAKDGKPSATVAFAPENVEVTVKDFRATESGVSFTAKQVRTLKTTKGDQKLTTELAFVGVPGKDPKVILGSTGNDRARTRAKLAATDKQELAANELTVRTPLPEPMTKIQQLNTKAGVAQGKMLREKDAEKKKELQKEFVALRKEAEEQSPALYREVVEKHPDSPAALDAALTVLRGAARNKLTADDAAKFVKVVQEAGTPYGPLFVGVSLAPVAETLAAQPGLEAVAVAAIEPAAKAMTDDHPAATQSLVLSAYQTALAKAGKSDQAKAIGVRVAKLEEKIDAEYMVKVPPFKPAAFAGRKDQNANQVVMMELFTGAQCPPCVAADVAFDALVKAYKPTDLVLIQYHMHIPGSDPMTNPDTTARWDYYQKLFPYDPDTRTGIGGVPSSLFNGKVAGGGGGGMTAAEDKFNQYAGLINPLLEKTTEVKLAGKAKRTGDKLDIGVEVANGDGADVKLRLLVVEETVKYAGSNGIRFHHHVVRAMPGGAAGVAVKDKSFKHTAAVDLGEVRKGLTKYLDEYVAENPNRPFARPDRPMDMKAVRVIALVQNDKTGEILQSMQIEVEGRAVGGGE